MSKQMKLVLGVALGYAAYMAYCQLKRTQTVYVDSFHNAFPNVIDMTV